MPGGAFPPVGPMGCGSPPSSVLCAAKTATQPVSGRFACHSLPDTSPASVRSWCPNWARVVVEAPSTRQGFWSPGPPFRACDKETSGSPKFPSSPCGDMPRSQTPVVSWTLAKAPPGLLPSSACKPSASHDDTHFGAPSRGLSPRFPRLRTPPYGDARGFATDLLARLSSGGTCANCAHPLGNYNQFHEFSLTPKVSGFPWREHAWFGSQKLTHVKRDRPG